MSSITTETQNKIEYKGECTSKDGQRFYQATDGLEYISVTSLLSRYEDVAVLKAWEERIGVEQATLIREESIIRGVNAHRMIESFLESRVSYQDALENLDNIYASQAIETFYSKIKSIDNESTVFFNDDVVRYAGRYDSIVEIPDNTFYYKKDGTALEGGYALVDLKTKNTIPRFDRVDYLLKYALQGAAYTFAKPEIDIKYFIIVFVSNKKCKMVCLSRLDLAFYFNYFYRLCLDYYQVVDDLIISWKSMIACANCDYDFETDNYIDYIPKEILTYSNLRTITILT